MTPAQGSGAAQALVGQRYRLVRRLDEDAFVQTWEAFDTRLERAVALRLLAPAAREDPGARSQLWRGARQPTLGADAEDPEAPRVLDGGEDATHGPFVVAELTGALRATRPLPPLASRPSGLAPPSEATLRLPGGPEADSRVGRAATLAPPRVPGVTPAPTWPVELPQRGPGHGAAGRLALAGLVVVLLATLAFLVRTCAPAEPSSSAPVRPATPEPARPRSGAPAVTAAVAPTLPPTSPAQAAAGSPVDTIRQHYALIDARRYSDGYALMDARLRRLNSPAEYAGWFANKVSVTPLSIELVSQTDTQAMVRSVVQTTDRINGQEVTTQVTEQFVLRNEDGAWRIDQVSRL